MAKTEVAWKRRDAEGDVWQVYAHRTGRDWQFYARHRRNERWAPVPQPPLEDWLELLDGVQRRVARRLFPPEEENRVRGLIEQRFPDVQL